MPVMHDVARRLHHASVRMQQWDYSLSGLVGFEVHGKTVGVIGTGAIGVALCAILKVRSYAGEGHVVQHRARCHQALMYVLFDGTLQASQHVGAAL